MLWPSEFAFMMVDVLGFASQKEEGIVIFLSLLIYYGAVIGIPVAIIGGVINVIDKRKA